MPRLLLVHQPVEGGVARHVADIFRGVQAAGWEVAVCGPAAPSASRLSPVPELDAAHIPLAMGREVTPRADLAAARELARIIRRVRPDVVHAHSSKAGAVARLARIADPARPLIYTPHGFAFNGHFERELERRAYRGVERMLMPLATRVLTVCEAEGRLARSVGGGRRVRVVHNGVDVSPAGARDPRVVALRDHGPVICTVTGLRPGKGLETLISALPALLATCPRTQLAIIGEGPLRDDLAAQATREGCANAVHFLGDHEDPPAALRAADVFVLPSWAEAFPFAMLEAMAVGLPVVISDVGGVREAIDDGRHGLLVPAKDAPALTRALARVCGEPVLARQLATAGQRRVQSEFTVAHMVHGIGAVYREALAGA